MITLLLACSAPESTGTWMESAGFDWALFNHRLSHLELGVGDTDAYASIVGGTSTTGLITELDDGCDFSTCQEFPFLDEANVVVGWGRVTSRKATFASASVDLLLDRDGASTTLTIPLPHRARGTATAVIRGFDFDTSEPLAGDPACYQPPNGWVPKSFGITLSDVTLADDGESVDVTVAGTFVAGLTHEEERECLDAVVDRAQIALDVDVLVVVTRNDAETIPVEQSLEYAYSGDPFEPGEQPDPDWSQRTLSVSVDDPLVGWSRIDWTFHEVGQSRGAYIRNWFVEADLAANRGSGHATNFSPVTQLSGFDYVFRGSIEAVDVGAEVERGRIEETLTELLDDAEVPLVHRFDM